MDALYKGIGFKGIRIIFAVIAATGLLCGCGIVTSQTTGEDDEQARAEFFGMDTYITFTAYGSGAKAALQEAEDMMSALEKKWSVTEEDSEIYRVNHGGGQPIELSDDTAEIVEYALDMAEETDGALDPTIYPILTAWGFTTQENRIPKDAEIKEILRKIGYEQVAIDGNQIRIPKDMELDLGAVGKGYAGDMVIRLLKERGISSAILDLGGNIQTIGSKPDGSDWRLGIRNPFGEGSIGVLSVSDCAVVTSGNYERYFIGGDGTEYGHIIDPDTGYPVDNELASVTIIAEEGKLADALSTSMIVKGLEEAEEYWKEHPGFEMIAVTDNGTVWLTEGIQDAFSLSGAFANMEIAFMQR